MSFITLDKNKKRDLKALFLWCRRMDSNPQDVNHTNLNRARLPIPPLRHKYYLIVTVHVRLFVADALRALSKNDYQSFFFGRVPLRHKHSIRKK